MIRAGGIGVTVLGALALISTASAQGSGTKADTAGSATKPHNLQVQTLAGEPVNLPALVEGKPTLLVFWATWCPSCRQQMPHVQAAFERFASQGLNVVTIDIAVKDTPATAKQYAAEKALSFPIYFDGDHEATKAYKVAATPGVLLLDREGTVVSSANEVDVAAIEALLAGQPIPAAKRPAMPRGSGSM